MTSICTSFFGIFNINCLYISFFCELSTNLYLMVQEFEDLNEQNKNTDLALKLESFLDPIHVQDFYIYIIQINSLA